MRSERDLMVNLVDQIVIGKLNPSSVPAGNILSQVHKKQPQKILLPASP
jgi:hypothetical protein